MLKRGGFNKDLIFNRFLDLDDLPPELAAEVKISAPPLIVQDQFSRSAPQQVLVQPLFFVGNYKRRG